MSLDQEKYKNLKERFGAVSSWAIWKEPHETSTSNIANLSVFDDPDILSKLNTGYVFVGLNAANHNQEQTEAWRSFHSEYRYQKDYKLRYALMGDDRFWGSYITDVVKNYTETDSIAVQQYIKKHPEFVMQNLEVLKKELTLLGGKKPVLVALGNAVYSLLKKNLKNEYEIKKIPHYSSYISKENYRVKVQEALKDCERLV